MKKRIEFRAGKVKENFQILPVLQIEHSNIGFAIVIGWGHYRTGIKFNYLIK